MCGLHGARCALILEAARGLRTSHDADGYVRAGRKRGGHGRTYHLNECRNMAKSIHEMLGCNNRRKIWERRLQAPEYGTMAKPTT